jgi:hypothetical protein
MPRPPGKTLQSLGGPRTVPTPNNAEWLAEDEEPAEDQKGLFAHFWHFFADAMELVTAPPGLGTLIH